MKRIDEIITSLQQQTTINGKDAFELYDTYGFPIDLTRLIATENNLNVDEEGFETEMQQQKNRSRAATAVDTEDWIVLNESNSNEFVGYDSLETKTTVIKIPESKSKRKRSLPDCIGNNSFLCRKWRTGR